MEEHTRTIFGRLKISKYKKTKERSDSTFHVSSFNVKALRIDGVPVNTLEIDASNEAVDVALGSIGSLETRNKHDTILKVSPKNGVEIISKKTKKQLCSYLIHEIAYCNVDKRYPEIFVFMGAKVKTDVRCRIFLCDDQAKARAICLTMARCFDITFKNWQTKRGMNENNANAALTGRRKTYATQDMGDIRCKNIGRVRSSSLDDTFNAGVNGGGDMEMDRTFEKIMEKSTHHGKYMLLGRRGSTDWESIEEDEDVVHRMQGGRGT